MVAEQMKFVSRLVTLLALLGVTSDALAQVAARHSPSATRKQAPGFYRGYLGMFEVIALSDGTAPRHLDQILSKPNLVREELSADHQAEPVPLSINAYLINTGSHVVLVDTGAGELFGPTSGALISNLSAAGYAPGQIDIILLTHIHADHSGGLSVGGERQFPNATVYVDKRDLDYFVTRPDSAGESETIRTQITESRATVGPYVTAREIALIEADREVVAGITSLRQPGHTPGHTAYLVTSSGHALLLWGDIIHSGEVQFEHPAVTAVYDAAPGEAAQTRLRQLQFAADRGTVVGSAHISFPGLGHIRKVGAAYRWVPIPYNAIASELDPTP